MLIVFISIPCVALNGTGKVWMGVGRSMIDAEEGEGGMLT